jgi:hypothetical protein
MVLHRSLRETSLLPQKLQGLQKRQTQNREIVAFDALKELNTKTLKLIGADTRGRGSA